MDPFIGEIRAVGFNFAPRNWNTCHGQLLTISDNTALFSLIGTFYGGDGRTTLGLPDLRGRCLTSYGTEPGYQTRGIGQGFGQSTHYLGVEEMPSHTSQAIYGSTQIPLGTTVSGEVDTGGRDPSPLLNGQISENKPIPVNLNTTPAGGTGVSVQSGFSGISSHSIANYQPSIAINYIIALQGTYPSRN